MTALKAGDVRTCIVSNAPRTIESSSAVIRSRFRVYVFKVWGL
jgi:hypothetical protein